RRERVGGGFLFHAQQVDQVGIVFELGLAAHWIHSARHLAQVVVVDLRELGRSVVEHAADAIRLVQRSGKQGVWLAWIAEPNAAFERSLDALRGMGRYVLIGSEMVPVSNTGFEVIGAGSLIGMLVPVKGVA